MVTIHSSPGEAFAGKGEEVLGYKADTEGIYTSRGGYLEAETERRVQRGGQANRKKNQVQSEKIDTRRSDYKAHFTDH